MNHAFRLTWKRLNNRSDITTSRKHEEPRLRDGSWDGLDLVEGRGRGENDKVGDVKVLHGGHAKVREGGELVEDVVHAGGVSRGAHGPVPAILVGQLVERPLRRLHALRSHRVHKLLHWR